MARVLCGRRGPVVVAVAVVVFAFWRALLAGGSLVSADIVATAPPFDAHRPAAFSLENGPGDPINIHAHWASLAADVRGGDVGWWDRDLAGGQPTMKGGLPVFNLAYLLVPSWYGPGLVAAIRTLVALGLAAGFLRAIGVGRLGALAGGLAFAFSGFMVGWMNWPHSSVAALAPGLLWAIERLVADPKIWRAGPLAAVVAAMVWANFPPVTIYLLLGGAFYGALRLAAEWPDRKGSDRIRPGLIVLGAAVVAVFLAAPHLVGFGDYLDWADTSHRDTGVDDSSAGIAYLMTAVAPAIWGSDAIGPSWFGEGNWVEYNAHVGASVVMLAVLGLVAALWRGDRRRRAAAAGLLVIAGLGVLIAYVGGPVGVLFGNLTGGEGGLMTRAKVLWSLGVALGAGLGVDLLGRRWSADERRGLRWVPLASCGVALVALLALAPSIANWVDAVRGHGVGRDVLAVSTTPAIAAIGVIVLAVGRWREAISPLAAGWALVVVVSFELLAFAMPVPTTVERAERLRATPAHQQVAELLEPGERLAGEGRTFFPATTELFDIDDARGQVLKSPGYQALLRAIDPDMLRVTGGGTATYPNIAAGTEVESPVWDAMGIGVWAQFPDTRPPGTTDFPPAAAGHADPAIQPLRATIEVPEGGIRAALLEFQPIEPGFIRVRVTGGGLNQVEQRWLEPHHRLQSFTVDGEDLAAGTRLQVTVRTVARPGQILVAIDERGSATVGRVRGDDGLRLVRAGDVTLLERPSTRFARLVDAVDVQPDPVAAAEVVATRDPGSPGAVVSRDVGLPSQPDPEADLEVIDLRIGKDRVEVDVRADRPALLVVSQVDYPGWSASVDGASASIVTADAAFVGVAVPAGAHRVLLEFRPAHLTPTLGLAGLGLGLLVVLLVPVRRRDLRSSAQPAR